MVALNWLNGKQKVSCWKFASHHHSLVRKDVRRLQIMMQTTVIMGYTASMLIADVKTGYMHRFVTQQLQPINGLQWCAHYDDEEHGTSSRE
jgi:hypothetical protein